MSASESSRSSGYESETGNETKRERKHQALLPPISSLCSALGGFEEFADAQGEIHLEYSLGDQVVGQFASFSSKPDAFPPAERVNRIATQAA